MIGFVEKIIYLRRVMTKFSKKNILLNRYEVYQTFFLPHKIENLSSYHGIIFFSPYGAKYFFLEKNI